MARLAELGVCLDVCPTSNFLLSVVDSLEACPHPLNTPQSLAPASPSLSRPLSRALSHALRRADAPAPAAAGGGRALHYQRRRPATFRNLPPHRARGLPLSPSLSHTPTLARGVAPRSLWPPLSVASSAVRKEDRPAPRPRRAHGRGDAPPRCAAALWAWTTSSLRSACGTRSATRAAPQTSAPPGSRGSTHGCPRAPNAPPGRIRRRGAVSRCPQAERRICLNTTAGLQ